MRWKRIAMFTVMFAIVAVAALIAMRPRPCDTARDRCADANGALPALGIVEDTPCNEGTMRREMVSCDYLRRHRALEANGASADGHGSDGVRGIWRSSDEMGSRTELTLDDDGWIALTMGSDLGSWGVHEGRYTLDRGHVIVAWNPGATHWMPEMEHDDYIPVGWGPRWYLVAAADLPRFVNAINSGFHRGGRHAGSPPFALSRVGGPTGSLPLCGLPRLPDEWGSRLHPTPLVVSIRTIEPDRAHMQIRDERAVDRYLIEVDAGAQAGVFPGMELSARAEDDPHDGITATIDSVSADRSTGTLRVEPTARGVRVGAGLALVSGAIEWSIQECVGT